MRPGVLDLASRILEQKFLFQENATWGFAIENSPKKASKNENRGVTEIFSPS